MKDLIKYLKDIKENKINCDYENCFIEIDFNNKVYLVIIGYEFGNFSNTACINIIWDGGIDPLWEGKKYFNFVKTNRHNKQRKKINKNKKD